MKIQTLEIFTPKLEQQTKFYAQVLELDIIEKTKTSVSFQIGNSVLKLSYREEFSPYHYAINIPANQEKEALEWLKARVEIIEYKGLEIQYFEAWNANAIYFYDEDGNIGELIARKKLDNHSNKTFDKNSLLEICEIGIPTFDVKREYDLLNQETGIPIHSGELKRFCAIGDSHGLFILINKELKQEWFPTKDKPFSADFNIKFEENGEVYSFEYKNEILKLLQPY